MKRGGGAFFVLVLVFGQPSLAQTNAAEDRRAGVAAFEQKDYLAAASALRRAAGLGDAGAMCYLGDMALDGLGVAQNSEEAVNWYCKAALAGDQEGVDRLAILNLGGWVESRDEVGWEQACRTRLEPPVVSAPPPPPPAPEAETQRVQIDVVRESAPDIQYVVPYYPWPPSLHRPTDSFRRWPHRLPERSPGTMRGRSGWDGPDHRLQRRAPLLPSRPDSDSPLLRLR